MEPGKHQQEFCNELTLNYVFIEQQPLMSDLVGGVILLWFSLEKNILGSVC